MIFFKISQEKYQLQLQNTEIPKNQKTFNTFTLDEKPTCLKKTGLIRLFTIEPSKIKTMFPFTVKFSKKFERRVSFADNEKIMTYIEEFIQEKSGDKIEIDGQNLTYKSLFSSFRYRFNILSHVEKGIFHLDYNGDDCELSYEFFMYRLFAIATILTLVFGIYYEDPLTSAIFFVLFGVINWIIAIIRHRMMLGDLMSEIETYVIGLKGNR